LFCILETGERKKAEDSGTGRKVHAVGKKAGKKKSRCLGGNFEFRRTLSGGLDVGGRKGSSKNVKGVNPHQ